jgi:phage baseplate assembly protein gpV
MVTTVERLQGEQTRLASTVETVRATGDGVDAERDKRLRQATQDIEQVRAGVEALQATWQRAQADTARLADELRTEVEAQRHEQTRDGARVRSAEEQAGRAQADVMAVAEKTARELEWLQGRLGQARRAVVKVVRRGRAAAMVADARAVARAQDCEQQVTRVREQTTAALEALRQDHAELTRAVTERLADLPSAAEHRTVMAFPDGCEAQPTEFAARLDAQGAVRVASGEESRQRLEAEVEGLKTVTDRLDGEQRRLAAEVEERLRGLMRTAAGGFDVQMALLRGKVEGLARTMRERVPVDPETPQAVGMLAHRHGLLERLRQQLAALQTGTDWHPRRVLDLLLESTLAAAVTSFRRIMELTEWHTSEEQEATAEAADATLTDESASPF